MKRFLPVFTAFVLALTLLFGGCTTGEVDRNKELQSAMKRNDMELSAAFLENAGSFSEVSDFLKEWAKNAGFEVTSDKKHYIVIKNPATEGMEDRPTTTLECSVDPLHIRKDIDLLSMAMAALLGPFEHGKITLMVTEKDEENTFASAETIKKSSLEEKHMIHLELGNSAMVYLSGPESATGHMSCKAPRAETKYSNAYEIEFTIPKCVDPYDFSKDSSYPNPIEVIGNLLATAKSSGRLFEIASFSCEADKGFLPYEAKALVVVDENNVESFVKRFDSSYESMEKKFRKREKEQKKEQEPDAAEEPLFTYTLSEADVPEKVLSQKSANNLISLMYTLQTGVTEQDEESGEITSLSYISNVSTSKGKFKLDMSMRGQTKEALKSLSDTYLITSGLCDVDYRMSDPAILWTSAEGGHLADFFFRAVDSEKEATPIYLGRSECDVLGQRGKDLDLIYYRVNKDHRNTAIKYILAYTAGEDVPEK